MSENLITVDPFLLAAIFSSLVMFGLIFYFWQSRTESKAREEVRKRLDIERSGSRLGLDGKPLTTQAASIVAGQMAKRSAGFYSRKDPEQKKKMQIRLMQAGYSGANALGYFFAARFLSAIGFFLAAMAAIFTMFSHESSTNQALIVLLAVTGGYFLPNFMLNQQIKKRQIANRQGFPDVLDLMVVSAEAGLTTEASIERIASEIRRTHPILSEQLHLAAIEIRAGKPLDESLRAFGERVGLDEVQGFATMIQQSKELGTSVSDALRVYSDEMRHKRMMAAEEKAYALPAKLSIPVTAFILPIVIGVAVVPTAVRMMTQ